MKLLIRTITIATIGLVLVLVILHATIVETTKYELDVATVAALNRTIDAFETNRKLLAEGEKTDVLFKNDSDYYYYFYDSLIVQLTGNVVVDVYCNDVDLKSGLLDVDTTILYRGLDFKFRTYTVHSDTRGRISDFDYLSEYKKNLLNKIATIHTGDKVIYGGHDWVVVDNTTENLEIMLDDAYATSIWTSSSNPQNLQYDYSSIKVASEALVNDFFKDEYEECKDQIAEATLDELNTFKGFYTNGYSDEAVTAKSYPISRSKAEKLINEGGYSFANKVWTRTAASQNEMYVVDGTDYSGTENIETELAISPVIKIIKVKLEEFSYEEVEGETIYTIK